jgi:hypothetical protein
MNTTQPIKRVKVCRCGQEFTVETRNQKSCPMCIEAKRAAEAAKPPKVCKRCGQSGNFVRHGICRPCKIAAEAKWCEEVRETRKRERLERFHAERQARQEPEPEQPAPQLDEVSELAMTLIAALLSFIGARTKAQQATAPAAVEDLSPEQIAVPDQDYIDAIAASLLADVEI